MGLTVGKKIAGGFVAIIILVAIMSGFTYWQIGKINSDYQAVTDNSLGKLELVDGVSLNIASEAVAMRRFNFTGDPADIPIFNGFRTQGDEKLTKIAGLMVTDEAKTVIQTIKEEKGKYEVIAAKSFEAKQANNAGLVHDYMMQAGKPYKASMAAAKKLILIVKAVVKDEQAKQQEQANWIQKLLLIVNLVIAVIAIIISFIVSRGIAKPLKAILFNVQEVAAGNLAIGAINLNSKDEVGQLAMAFNAMTKDLGNLISKIQNKAEQLAASSQELTASSEQSAQTVNHIVSSINDVSSGANEQLVAANETSAVVEQMSASIQQAAVNADQVAVQSAQAADKAKEGGKSVDKAVNQMGAITDTVQVVAEAVAKLNDKSKEIGQIVGTISGIAGQTNLLALNAAIEAARAGEQGRGFAVVAEEVRKLAEESQDAAKKIAELIGEIQGDTEKAVVSMGNGAREVKTGTEVVNAAGVAFRDIADIVTQVSGQVKELSAAIQQMATGSQQIVGAVKKIDGLSKKSAGEAQTVSAATEEQLASMEEIASSSQDLAKLAQELQSAVAKFRM